MAPFETILIANRGAIARRIIRTCRRLGVRAVGVFSDADAGSLHVADADEAVRIGPGPAAESYLRVDAILDAAERTGAQAIHPGYGFLSENAGFAEACAARGRIFIGPTPENIRVFGLKHTARALAQAHGVPLAPGSGLLNDGDAAARAAAEIGYPVMLKATAGGGGIGMRVCENEAAVRAAFDAVSRLGAGNFGDGGVFLERFVAAARHIEVQVFGNGAGRVVALGERDCSLQRRNQKVIEETPAPNLPERTRAALIDAAVRLMGGARYRSAGTVEFLYDSARDDFYFLEVNTRLQVEHGVTEAVTGVDLVEWMIRGAAGDYGVLDAPPPAARGASMQARIYAEDAGQDFRPSAGALSEARFPDGARIETWVENGTEVSTFYDPMLAKLIVHAPNRREAAAALQRALDGAAISGIETNLPWLRQVVRDARFLDCEVSTRLLDSLVYSSDGVRVLTGGPATTIQDYPGRLGYWDVGVPPSGPMDSKAFRIANRLLGNAPHAAALEFAAQGPALKFERDANACLTGADFAATLDGAPAPRYAPFKIAAGQVLRIRRVRGGGLRGYLAVRGGWDAPVFLGSRSTFTLGGFGGHGGRALKAGDVLRLADDDAADGPAKTMAVPDFPRAWTLRVSCGPHGAPDFFTEDDIAVALAADWRVHHNSNPTGIRLIGPKPAWARRDGGEAGLHPSNIHDNPYAVGAVDFTGDMPIILGPDGPSLGGFVCPFVVIGADLWKIGQLAPGDIVRFDAVDDEGAADAARALEEEIAGAPRTPPLPARRASGPPILHERAESAGAPRVLVRRQGDSNILVEFGPLVLDVELRLRAHALMLALEETALPGVRDLTPGVRSLQVHYDPARLSRARLIEAVERALDAQSDLSGFEIPSRIVHLPLSWDDPAIHRTVEKYVASVRADAPWTPDNIEFIRRINGLSSIEDVRRIVFDAAYLVLGLGDVYLGAPVATPLDPRHRLVTTKYNPARTWTPPNVVGIGGAYLCIYGMEGPGGYQLFGRTIQVWNSHRRTAAFEKPWLLRFFDQIRFFPVSHEELEYWRRDFPLGRRALRIEEETFRLSDYRAFLAANAEPIAAFTAQRNAAFAAERAAWEARGEFDRAASLAKEEPAPESDTASVPDGLEAVESPLGGTIWKICCKPGDRVTPDTIVAVVEAMKAECDVAAGVYGTVRAVLAPERAAIAAGAPIIAIEADG